MWRPKFDLRRYKVDRNERKLFWTRGRVARECPLAEEWIQYPKSDDIDGNQCDILVKYYGEEEEPEYVDLCAISQYYPHTMAKFITMGAFITPHLDAFIQRIIIEPTLTIPLQSLLYLKYSKSTDPADRVVMLCNYSVDGYVLPWMDAYTAKYLVKHVKWTDNGWILKDSMNEHRLRDGGAGYVSDNDVEVICLSDNNESYLKYQLFVSRKEVNILKKFRDRGIIEYKQMMKNMMLKWLRTKYSNQWKHGFSYILSSSWNDVLKRVFADICSTWNKSKTQQKINLKYSDLLSIFGDCISEEIRTIHGGHWILSITKLQLIFYPKKMQNNIKVSVYIKKTRFRVIIS